MATWISKAGAACLTLTVLSACEGGDGPASVLAALQAPKVPDDTTAAAAPDTPVALSRSMMAKQAFTLVPPEGYCIDKATLTQRFALMARCDALGVTDAAGGAAVGIITVSVTPMGLLKSLPTPQETADVMKLARFDAVKSENHAVTFRAEGPPPAPDFGVVHWRGSAQIANQVLGLALFGPKGGRVETPEGREILNALIRRSTDASDG